MKTKAPRRRLAREEAEDAIRSAIISGRLHPGTMVTEMELADALGFSRVPVREALRTLVSEGFVEVLQGRGVRVAGIDMKRVRDEFELRLALEPAAVAIACQRVAKLDLSELETITADLRECIDTADMVRAARLNAEFHHAVIRLAQNSHFEKLLPSIWSSLRLTLLVSEMELSVAVLNHDLESQHLELLDALRERNAVRASEIAASHIKASYNNHRSLVTSAGEALNIDSKPPIGADALALVNIPTRAQSALVLEVEREEEVEEAARM